MQFLPLTRMALRYLRRDKIRTGREDLSRNLDQKPRMLWLRRISRKYFASILREVVDEKITFLLSLLTHYSMSSLFKEYRIS